MNKVNLYTFEKVEEKKKNNSSKKIEELLGMMRDVPKKLSDKKQALA